MVSELIERLPFTKGYVLRVTTKHLRKSIDISIRKTFARVEEFADDPEKSREVFATLAVLHKLRNMLDEFQRLNSEEFKGN